LIFSYKTNLNYLHKNSTSGSDELYTEGSFLLYYFYDSLLVERRTEKLVYDLLGVFAAAGGNLGLCLGFSCLTVLYSFLNWIKERGYF
jgi:hypothetical protein